jgi:hypothetical protein
MADHFVSLTRGLEGEKYSDFTTGTSSSGSVFVELRIGDASTVPTTPTRVEIIKALEAFERFFSNPQQVSAAGFVVTG